MKKKLFYLFASIMVLCISCKKDKKDQTTPEPEPAKEIINTLISGTDCTRFERVIKGYKLEELRSVKQTADGGYIFCGSTETIAESEYDILIIKTDCFGATEWMKTISNSYSDFGYDITPLSSGGYFVTVNFTIDPNYWKMISHRGQFILLDSAGNVISKQNCTVGNKTVLTKAIETSDGGVLICGRDYDVGSFILKTDVYGNQIWIKHLDDASLYDVSIRNNNYLACGAININNRGAIYLVEMNAAGDTLWTKSIDKNIGGGASSITLLSNNDIALSGTYRTSNTTFAGFAMRLDATGKEIWYKSLEADGIQTLVNIVPTTGNDMVVVSTAPGALTIVKLDFSTGSIVWKIPRSSNTAINDFQLSADGGFIIVGSLFPNGGNRDGYILKSDKDGN